MYIFSQGITIPDDVKEENERIKLKDVAEKSKHMHVVHPVKKATQATSAYSSTVHEQTEDVDDAIAAVQQITFQNDDLTDETQIFSVLANFTTRKLEARRNIFDASTCLVEAVYKNNSVLAQMFTDALMPLCSSAASGDLDFEALLADAIKRGCSLSIINNVNQLWLKTQKKRKAKQLFDEYV